MKIGVIGSGSWGTAIAMLLARNGYEAKILSRSDDTVKGINNHNKNQRCFPDILLDKKITATTDVNELYQYDTIFIVLPVQEIRSFLVTNQIPKHINLVLCSKGIESSTLSFASDIVGNQYNIVIISGPNFASEIVRGLPASTTIASKNVVLANKIAALLNQSSFKTYITQDVIGTEICGAIKNVIAIAVGIFEGISLGENAKASLITKSLAEIGLLIETFGGDKDTIMGFAGVGDLILTCSSNLSRNRSFGISIATGRKFEAKTIEGFYTTKAIYEIGKKYQLDLPICYAIYKILYEDANPQDLTKGAF